MATLLQMSREDEGRNLWNRKRTVVRFMYEGKLIEKDAPFIDPRGLNLRDALLSWADYGGGINLSGANLRFARLVETNLSFADLRATNLKDADLSAADLSNADLQGADLSNADLSRARVTNQQLASCKSLKGATMPDGTMHP